MTNSSAIPAEDPVSTIDTSVPHSARVWNYWLGGKDNFAVDREAGDRVRAVFPRSSTTPGHSARSWAGPSAT